HALAGLVRGVAQPGRALRSGRRSRWFKSSHPDLLFGQAIWREATEVRGLHRSLVGAALAALLGASMARAESATTRERARLRRGPSGASELLAELPPGTALDVLGESGGWKQVRARDGKTGYVWAEHLAEAETQPPEALRTTPRSLADEVRDIHQEVGELAQRPEAGSAAQLERAPRRPRPRAAAS